MLLTSTKDKTGPAPPVRLGEIKILSFVSARFGSRFRFRWVFSVPISSACCPVFRFLFDFGFRVSLYFVYVVLRF